MTPAFHYVVKVNLRPIHILPVQTLYSVLYNYRCHMIIDGILFDFLLLNCLYSINWHYCSSGKRTDLSCSEYSSPEENTMAYRLEKYPFPWPIRITTLFEYQARRLMTEAVL